MKRFLSLSWAPALLATIAVIALGAVTTPSFFDINNFQNLIMQLAVVGMLSMGAGLVILTGEIDLSVGSMVSLLSMVLATLVVQAELPMAFVVPLVLLGGVILGSVNGVLVTYLRVPSFVATLGTLGVFGGIALLFNGGSPITGLSNEVQDIFYGKILGVPLPLIYMIVIIALLRVFLVRTVPGRSVYAVGGNSLAASLSGLAPNRIRLLAFMLAGLLTGVAAVLFAGRLGAGSPNLGAVVGGISLSGGRGDVLGALLGATTIVVVQNILNLNAVPPTWQSIVQGLIIIIAVSFDAWRGHFSFRFLRFPARAR
jgi:ribose transport system permease protein